MNQEQNDTPRYFQVTPSGAYYATLNTEPEALRALLLQLLSADTHIPYISSLLQKLTGMGEQDAQALLDAGFASVRAATPAGMPLDEAMRPEVAARNLADAAEMAVRDFFGE